MKAADYVWRVLDVVVLIAPNRDFRIQRERIALCAFQVVAKFLTRLIALGHVAVDGPQIDAVELR